MKLKYQAYYRGVRIGQSTTKEGAQILVKHAGQALFNQERIKFLEKKIRRIRNKIFDFENADKKLSLLKSELLIRRGKFVSWNCEELKREVERIKQNRLTFLV